MATHFLFPSIHAQVHVHTHVCACQITSVLSDSATLWTVACQAPLSVGFSRQEYWSGLPCPPSGHFPHPGVEPSSLLSPALPGGFFTTNNGLPWWLRGSSVCLQGGRPGLNPWVRKIPWRREWQPTPAFFLKNSTDRGAWWLLSIESQRVGHD